VTGFCALYLKLLSDQLVFGDLSHIFSLFMLTSINTANGLLVYCLFCSVLEIPEFSMLIKILKRSGELRGFLGAPRSEDNVLEVTIYRPLIINNARLIISRLIITTDRLSIVIPDE